AHERFDVASHQRSVRANRLERAGHDPFRLRPPHCREVVLDRFPVRLILIPVTHHFVHTTTVQTAGKTAEVIVEMASEGSTGRRQFQPAREAREVPGRSRPARNAGDVAVERLHHSEYELAHSRTPPHRFPAGDIRLPTLM